MGTVAVTASKIGSSISRDFGSKKLSIVNLENYENIAKFNSVEGTGTSDPFSSLCEHLNSMKRIRAASEFLETMMEMKMYSEKQLANAYMRFV